LKQVLEALDARSARLANARLAVFLISAALAVGAIARLLPASALSAALVGGLGFVVLVVRHARVAEVQARQEAAQALNDKARTRMIGGWRGFPATGLELAPANHPYAVDLDVVGQASLFARLDDTQTRGGERRLAQLLLELAPAPEALERQAAVRELAPRLEERQRLLAELRDVAKAKPDPEALLSWIESGTALEKITWAFPLAHLLPPITLTLLVLTSLEVLAPWAAAPLVLAQLAIVGLTRGAVQRTFAQLMAGEQDLGRYARAFKELDAWKVESPRLSALHGSVSASGPKVSQRLAGFDRLFGLAALRASKEVHWLINVLFLWDVHWFVRLEKWRAKEAQGARAWLTALAEIEALCCLAQHAFEHPADAWPTVEDGAFALELGGLRHPLLDAAVANDVALPGPGEALIVTGSNMSGKTTLLRAMGLAVVMARAGLPVAAERARIRVQAVVTSMRVKDSLERGVSYFYAEVQRIKSILDVAQGTKNGTLFLLDELFLGTNTRERQIASRALLEHLLASGASGAITTHDLALTELPGAKIRNVHLRDELKDGEMTFDYRLREGVVQGSNALEILRRAGVPV